VTAHQLQTKSREGTEYTYSKVLDALESKSLLGIDDEKDGVYRVKLSLGKNLERLMWVDTQRGFAPIRFKQQLMSKTSSDVTEIRVVETNWEQVNNIWVPTMYRDEGRHGNVGAKEMMLKWDNVNESIPHDLFVIDNDIKSRTIVLDDRLEPPLIEKIIGTEIKPSLTFGGEKSFKWWLIVANVAAIIAILVLIVIRRSRRQTG